MRYAKNQNWLTESLKRENLEDIIFEKFVEGSVATDFSEKVKHYKEGFSEYKKLLTEYPRRQNRVTENGSGMDVTK